MKTQYATALGYIVFLAALARFLRTKKGHRAYALFWLLYAIPRR